jgi:glycosyltransferase involved in cell wall biosynthesis
MRVLWVSDSPDTPSGFGNVTRFVCEGLARRGHHVSILGWQTVEQEEWNGCHLFPASGGLGGRSLHPFLLRHRPEIVIALADVWWLPYFSAPHIRRQMLLTDTPWALYFPIDGDMEGGGLPPSWVELLRDVDVPIAMSEFGRETARRSGIDCHYIPHGVDRHIFSPPADRDKAKAEVSAAGKFLVLSDSRNQPRKMLPRLLDVFKRFAAGRPDVLLHLHTDPDDEFTKSAIYSYNVRADIRHLGIEDQVRFTPGMLMKRGGGVPLTEIAKFYQAADVHLLASSGEGFGLPTLQAAAAGAVPFAGAYSASLELVAGHGEAINIGDWTENEFGIRRALIDIEDAVAKLNNLYDDRLLLMERSRESAAFASRYDWNRVLDQWDELLRSVAASRRRISRVPAAVPLHANIANQYMPQVPYGTVTVNVVEQKFGRLEAGFIADTRGRVSDIRIPPLPEPCVLGGLRLLRSPGYVGLAYGDRELFCELQSIFPVLTGWSPVSRDACHDEPAVEENQQDFAKLIVDRPEDARYDLAQSILLLNVSGGICDQLLVDAALFGVVCIGSPASEAQQVLWPDLMQTEWKYALDVARRLLTNAALLRRFAVSARGSCFAHYAPDEAEAASFLRTLHAARSSFATARPR